MEYKAKIQISEKILSDIFRSVNAKRGRENKDKNIAGFVYTFNKYADYFAIDTPLEVRHFIAQITHESDQFNAYEEYASGSAYEGRKDLGNVFKGDGVKFKGRGPIQITGRANYKKMGTEIAKLPFLNDRERKIFENDGLLKDPSKLQDPVWGTLAALIFWVDKGLNSLCVPDNQKVTIKRLNSSGWYNYTCSPIEAITRKINGGINGFEDRIKNYEALKKSI